MSEKILNQSGISTSYYVPHHAEAQIRQGVEVWAQLQDRLRELAGRLVCWRRSKNSQGLRNFSILSSLVMCGLAVPASHILRIVQEVPISDAI
jgi:hypothetical protein